MSSETPLLTVNDISLAYGSLSALSRCSFAVQRGTFSAIIGPNGAGKTTLLKIISGALRPSQGGVCFDGVPISTLSKRRMAQRISYVPQMQRSDIQFRVEEMVMMGRNPYISRFKRATSRDFDAVDAAVEQTGIHSLKKRRVCELSGGEQQRVFIARALAQEPELLLLDEPVSNLDLKYQLNILQLLKRMSEKKPTVITVLHDINAALRYSDSIIMLKSGLLHGFIQASELNASRIEEVYGVKTEIVQDRLGFKHVIPVL